jgi:hypothetical protein
LYIKKGDINEKVCFDILDFIVCNNAFTPMNYEYISFINTCSEAWTINLIQAGERKTDYCDWGTVTWVSE